MPDRFGDFEAGAGRLTRQVVENATAPVRDAGLVLIDAAFRWLSRFTLGLLIKTVAAVVAAVCLVIAVGLGFAAVYVALVPLVGSALAFLILALGFVCLAAAMLIVAVYARTEPRPSDALTVTLAEPEDMMATVQPEAVSMATEAPPVTPDHMPHEPAAGLRGTAEALSTMLGAAGLKQQQAGVQAGLALAERLTPFQLAILGAIVAFSGSRDLKRQRSQRPDAG